MELMIPTWIGLFIALILPGILAWVSEKLFASNLKNALIAQFFLLLQCFSLILIAIVWEQQSLSSLGIRPLRWETLGLGLIFGLFFIYIFSPFLSKLMQMANIPFFTEGLAKLNQFPTWYLLIAVILGGFAEELFYRGYGVERLAELSGNYWLAGIISTFIFGLVHVPLWGWGGAATTWLSGGLLTGFYVWQQDLLANAIAHIITDATGIILNSKLTNINNQ